MELFDCSWVLTFQWQLFWGDNCWFQTCLVACGAEIGSGCCSKPFEVLDELTGVDWLCINSVKVDIITQTSRLILTKRIVQRMCDPAALAPLLVCYLESLSVKSKTKRPATFHYTKLHINTWLLRYLLHRSLTVFCSLFNHQDHFSALWSMASWNELWLSINKRVKKLDFLGMTWWCTFEGFIRMSCCLGV